MQKPSSLRDSYRKQLQSHPGRPGNTALEGQEISDSYQVRAAPGINSFEQCGQFPAMNQYMDHSMFSGRCLGCPQKGGPKEHHLHTLSHPEPFSGELSCARTSLVNNLSKHCCSSTGLDTCLGRRTVFSLIGNTDGTENLLAIPFCPKSSKHTEGRFKKHSMARRIHSKTSPETLAFTWKLFQ